MKATLNLRWAVLLSALLATCACNMGGDRESVGETQTESRTVELGGARRENVKMGAGELKVAGGSSKLMGRNLHVQCGAMEAGSEIFGERRRGQPGRGATRESGHATGHTRYAWDLHLNNKVPMDIQVDMGAGKSTLTLGGMALEDPWRVNIGAGETTVDLTGDWKNNLGAEFDGGVGKAIVCLVGGRRSSCNRARRHLGTQRLGFPAARRGLCQ